MSALGYTMYADSGMAPKVLLFGPCILFMGVGLIVVPGPNVTVKDIQEKKSDFKGFLSQSTTTQKILWVMSGAVGLIFYVMRDAIADLL